MYKKLVILLISLISLTSCNKEEINKMEEEIQYETQDTEIETEDVFCLLTQDSIESAMSYAQENLPIKIPGAKFLSVYYDSDINYEITSQEQYKDIEIGNKIVVFTDFVIENEGDNPVFSKGTYKGYRWVFKREDSESSWELINQGF